MSVKGSVYRVLKTDMDRRFWDDVTKLLFKDYIKLRYAERES
jgi:hypothetical protein